MMSSRHTHATPSHRGRIKSCAKPFAEPDKEGNGRVVTTHASGLGRFGDQQTQRGKLARSRAASDGCRRPARVRGCPDRVSVRCLCDPQNRHICGPGYFALQSIGGSAMRDLDKVLDDIIAIRSQIARSAEFRGYGPATVATTGVLAMLGAVVQAVWIPYPAVAVAWYLDLLCTT